MVIARREAPTGRPINRFEGPAIEARFKGETFTIQFSQGYRRVHLDADKLAKRKKEDSWAFAIPAAIGMIAVLLIITTGWRRRSAPSPSSCLLWATQRPLSR
ncbi:hypothetical protein QTI51_38565 [Variovorax sp. J22G73]|uniref:hypothetical protein n=1 Tax=unclassified Variovorax TaxID=663243 RepID=UPI0025754879|nr:MULTISPECIES: hypothetical protein [unclassified Variovorax]MDM0010208.1 hypothetical protein [Variovorax sp. J22R203]MDM0103228.1 hypothetical protein [Variovorax sp. J22G73]